MGRQGTLLPSLRALLANPEVSHVRALVKEVGEERDSCPASPYSAAASSPRLLNP